MTDVGKGRVPLRARCCHTQGTLKAVGTIWVPAAYREAQQRAVTTFFQQNGYISYDILNSVYAPSEGSGCIS